MASPYARRTESPFRRGMIISPAADLGGVQTPDGGMLSPDVLGPGVVEALQPDGQVCVRWVKAGIETCLDPADVRALEPDAHLVTVMKRDKHGSVKLVRHVVVARVGLQSNWTVEVLPNNMLRAVRSDGAAWTFRVNRVLGRIEVLWLQPPEDDDAEAFTVAERIMRERV